MNKYEQLIEYIVNEEQDKARDLFHEIVVEKSREIYESIINEDDLVGGDEADDLIDDIEADEEGLSMEDVDFDLEEGRMKDAVTDMQEQLHDFAQEIQKGMHSYDNVVDELNDMFDEVKDMGDPIVTNAFKVLRSLEPEDFGEGEGGGPNRASSVAQDVMDIIDGSDDSDYDHLPNLEEADEEDMDMDAEFDYNNDGEMDDHEEDHGEIEDRVVDLEDALDELKAEFDKLMDQEGSEADEDDEDEAEETEESFVREYTEKAPEPKKSEEGANTKSIVAGKNNMGGSASNIAQGGDEKGAKPKMPKSMAGTTKPDMKAAPKAVTKDGADNTDSTIGS